MTETHSLKPPHVLERAFQLARSGRCRSKRDIAQALAQEGYTRDELEHLSGRHISDQLVHLFSEAPAIH